MATNDKLLQAIKAVGDLRERIGASRVKFDAEKAKLDTMRANLEALERELAEKERDVDSLVRVSWTPERTARPRVTAPASHPPPKAVAAPPVAAQKTRPFALRKGSLATRIVDLLNATPDRSFTTHELARQFNIEIRQVYGTLSRLSTKLHLIERVSEGVFRAKKGGKATAA